MSSKNTKSTRLIIILLSLMLVVLIFKNYKDNKSALELQNSLKQESFLTQSQLSEMLNKYDSVLSMYNNMDKSALVAINNENNQVKYIDSNNLQNISTQIEKIKDSIGKLKERLVYLQKLKKENTDQANKDVSKLAEIKSGSELKILDLQVRGVKFLKKSSTSNDKFDIEQLRVCFTLEKNLTLLNSEKEFYIQVVNPKNSTVTPNNYYFDNNTKTLQYSKKIKFIYDKNITDVCEYVDLDKNKILKGRYIVNLYNGSTKIASTQYMYN